MLPQTGKRMILVHTSATYGDISRVCTFKRVMHTSRELLTSAMVMDTPPFAACDGAMAKDLIFCLHLIVCAHEHKLQSENVFTKSHSRISSISN